MKSKTLATVLIKYFGFTTFISGIITIISGVPNVFWAFGQRDSSHLTYYWEQALINYGAIGAIHLLIGVFLFTKASYIVSTFINVQDELQS